LGEERAEEKREREEKVSKERIARAIFIYQKGETGRWGSKTGWSRGQRAVVTVRSDRSVKFVGRNSQMKTNGQITFRMQ
jgi:hypothetical protein